MSPRARSLDRPTVQLVYRSAAGRWVVVATILGSALAAIDGTVVTIALPAIGRDLDTDFGGLQWTVTGYTIALASLILISGAAGDRYGRRRMFLIGVVWFTSASVLCALAPSVLLLVAARILQGVGGALLTPASLAILEASFTEDDRSAAISTWAGFSGVAGALAPFVGGWLLGLGSWRWVFLVNVPLAALVVAVSVRHMPETFDPDGEGHLDTVGAVLTVGILGAGTYAIIDRNGGAAVVAVVCLVAWLAHERRSAHPLVPLQLFRVRQFVAVNAITFVAYAAIGVFFFLLVLQLQVVAGWSPLAAGSATIPVTVLTVLLSRSSGRLAQRIGPRPQMTLGPLLCATGAFLSLRIDSSTRFVSDVLPAVSVFGIGLATMVAPLTSTALSALPDRHAGLASGVNNAVARTGALLAIAAVPVVAGLTGNVFDDPDAFAAGFGLAVGACIALFVTGSLLSAVTINRPGDGHLAVHRHVDLHVPVGSHDVAGRGTRAKPRMRWPYSVERLKRPED